MFERMSESARLAMLRGPEEAMRLSTSTVTTGHFLLALLSESSWTAAQILDQFGVTASLVRTALLASTERESDPAVPPRWSDDTRHAIDDALQFALKMGSTSIESEHLLWGILNQPSFHAREILSGQGVDVAALLHVLANKTMPVGVEEPTSQGEREALCPICRTPLSNNLRAQHARATRGNAAPIAVIVLTCGSCGTVLGTADSSH